MNDKYLDDVNKALGGGEEYDLSNGRSITVYPVRIADLKLAMKMWDQIGTLSMQAIYVPGNEERLRTFENLLLWANDKRDLWNEEGDKNSDEWKQREESREAAVQEILSQFSTMADQGAEVLRYLDRFLGFVPRITGAAEKAQTKQEGR